MKATEFMGKTVIDKTGLEVGKVEDIIIKSKKCLIDRIIIVTGGMINKKYFSVVEKNIEGVGDYILLNLDKNEIESQLAHEDKNYLKKVETNFEDVQGKTVITKNGVELGTVEDIIIQPDKCLIENIIVKAKDDLGKKPFLVGEGEINDIKDYMVLNLELDEVEDRII